MGSKANLPLYEAIVLLLESVPGIQFRHINGHGPLKEQGGWTREQWGNYCVDVVSKGQEDDWAPIHIRWPMSEVEALIMSISPWHWISNDRRNLLEPIQSLVQRNILISYLAERDVFDLKGARRKNGRTHTWDTSLMSEKLGS